MRIQNCIYEDITYKADRRIRENPWIRTLPGPSSQHYITDYNKQHKQTFIQTWDNDATELSLDTLRSGKEKPNGSPGG